jgi:hypothetical protein
MPIVATTTESWSGYQLEWIREPAGLAPTARTDLLGEFQDLAKRTYERDIGDYFLNQPGYFDEMTRLVVIRQPAERDRGAEIAGFVALREDLRVAGERVVYLKSAIVAPEHQKHGLSGFVVLRAALDALADGPEICLAMRTQNPVVYAPFAAVFEELHPSLSGREIAPRIATVARALAAELSPECRFDDRRMVIEGLYRFSQRFFDDPPTSGWEAVDDLFRRELDYSRQDGFLVIAVVGRAALAAAIAKIGRFDGLRERASELAHLDRARGK